jgi:chitinase
MGWWGEGMGVIYNVSSISIASFYLNLDAIKVLLSVGSDITDMTSVRDTTDSLPLHWATSNYRRRIWMSVRSSTVEKEIQGLIKVIELLLEAHPQAINCQDIFGNTPLHHATRHPFRQHEQYTAVVELLCSKGADASLRNNKKETPIHTLLSRQSESKNVDPKAIGVLIANGASLMDIDEAGNSPLHRAAMEVNHADVITYLLHHGADPNLRNAAQDTPLHLAASTPCWSVPGGSLDENERLQDNVMAILSKAAGPTGVEMLNGERKTAREICQEKRKMRRDQEIENMRLWKYGRGGRRGRGNRR